MKEREREGEIDRDSEAERGRGDVNENACVKIKSGKWKISEKNRVNKKINNWEKKN